LKPLNSILISGREVLPIVEGGKGVAVSVGASSGAFAAAGAVGTYSCVNADTYDEDGNVIPQIYHGKTRRERFEELIEYAIRGGIMQAQISHEISKGEGRIHLNALWEAGGTERILEGVLEGAKGLVHGITCGAGMPYKAAEIAVRHQVYYHPIVSSMRAFRALWKRAYRKAPELLGSVVYEDPWRAGGHNGLTNAENPEAPEDPYPRVAELRKFMNEVGLETVPILMAGGVWYLRDWADWIDNPELGPIGFQYGTRPLLTQESPISDAWKKRLLTLKDGDVFLNRFSPTGFYSSAVNNNFIGELRQRSDRQIPFAKEPEGEATVERGIGARARKVYVSAENAAKMDGWVDAGFTEALRTPDQTLIFVAPQKAEEIKTDQRNCMGCLSQCKFSNWADNETGNTGHPADPRSFCIQKTLQSIGHGGTPDDELMFAGHNAFMFADDPFYNDGFIPTVAQLVDRIKTGD